MASPCDRDKDTDLCNRWNEMRPAGCPPKKRRDGHRHQRTPRDNGSRDRGGASVSPGTPMLSGIAETRGRRGMDHPRESEASLTPPFQTASLQSSVVLNHPGCDHLSWDGCPRRLTRKERLGMDGHSRETQIHVATSAEAQTKHRAAKNSRPKTVSGILRKLKGNNSPRSKREAVLERVQLRTRCCRSRPWL